MASRVLFINRSYWPDIEATGQLLTQLCTGLADEFEIDVIAGSPNYTDKAAMHSHGGVTIHQVNHTHFSKFSAIGKMVNLLTFTLAAFLKARKLRPDIVITETDPFLLPLIGKWMKRRRGCKFVAYLQDVYPDVAVAVGAIREGFTTKALRRLLVRAYGQADRVIVLSDDMKDRCVNNGVPPEKIEVIHNWADCEKIRPIAGANGFRKKLNLENKFIVMYSGNHGRVHALEPLIRACEILKNDNEIHFVFIGEGVQKAGIQQFAEDHELQNVTFLPYQPQGELSQSFSAADVHVVTMLAEAVGCVMPSKLYGILAAGRAVLAICPFDCDLSRIVRTHQVGRVQAVDSRTLPQDIAETIQEMRLHRNETREYGHRARMVCETEFSRSHQLKKFQDVFHKLLGTMPLPAQCQHNAAGISCILACFLSFLS